MQLEVFRTDGLSTRNSEPNHVDMHYVQEASRMETALTITMCRGVTHMRGHRVEKHHVKVAWGLCRCMLIRFSTVWLLPFNLL